MTIPISGGTICPDKMVNEANQIENTYEKLDDTLKESVCTATRSQSAKSLLFIDLFIRIFGFFSFRFVSFHYVFAYRPSQQHRFLGITSTFVHEC